MRERFISGNLLHCPRRLKGGRSKKNRRGGRQEELGEGFLQGFNLEENRRKSVLLVKASKVGGEQGDRGIGAGKDGGNQRRGIAKEREKRGGGGENLQKGVSMRQQPFLKRRGDGVHQVTEGSLRRGGSLRKKIRWRLGQKVSIGL